VAYNLGLTINDSNKDGAGFASMFPLGYSWDRAPKISHKKTGNNTWP